MTRGLRYFRPEFPPTGVVYRRKHSEAARSAAYKSPAPDALQRLTHTLQCRGRDLVGRGEAAVLRTSLLCAAVSGA